MRTSGTGIDQVTRPARSEYGFTLVEILVVVFIIGLSSGLVIMSLPERVSALEAAAGSVRQDLEDLQDRAVLTGVPHAIAVSAAGYERSVWRGGAWVPVNLPEREFAGNVSIEIDRIGLIGGREEGVGRIVFDPSGVPVLGVVVLSAEGERVEIALGLSDQERSQ